MQRILLLLLLGTTTQTLLLLLSSSSAVDGFLVPLPLSRHRPSPTTTIRHAAAASSSSSGAAAASSVLLQTSASSSPPPSPAPAQEQRVGRVMFEGFDPAVGASVGETLSVIYNPAGQGLDPPLQLEWDDMDLDVDARSPCLLYNFNGWDGETPPLRTPFFPRGDGTLVATVHIPNFAKILDCIVSDGQLGFDTEGGRYFHLLISKVQEEREGVVYNYLQNEDGSLILTGVEANNDAQELERMIEEELSARSSNGGSSSSAVAAFEEEVEVEVEVEMEEEEMIQEEGIEEEDMLLVDTGATLEEEDEEDQAFSGGQEARDLASTGSIGVHVASFAEGKGVTVPQQLRAEATAVGEALGISSSMIINELREAFDSVTDADTLTFDELPRALAKVGMDFLNKDELEELCVRFQGPAASRTERRLTLEHFMRMFHALDQEDAGITIV